LQAIVATLSTGPVAIGDEIGSSDIDLIMSTTRADGQLLKPDIPAMVIDKVFLQFGNSSTTPLVSPIQVWSSETTIEGYTWTFLLAINLAAPFTVYPSDLGLSGTSLVTLYPGFSEGEAFSSSNPINLDAMTPNTTVPFKYMMICPLLSNNWFIVGEYEKIVPVSNARISDLVVHPDGVDLVLAGAPSEVVNMRFVNANFQIFTGTCTISSSGICFMTCGNISGEYQCTSK
jgi:hypothetical protein